jgi:hypothetical protein
MHYKQQFCNLLSRTIAVRAALAMAIVVALAQFRTWRRMQSHPRRGSQHRVALEVEECPRCRAAGGRNALAPTKPMLLCRWPTYLEAVEPTALSAV